MFSRLWKPIPTNYSVQRTRLQLVLCMAGSSTYSMDVKLPTNMPKSQSTQFYRRPLPAACIDFASEEGKRIFAEALSTGYMNAFFKLCAQFRTQDEPAYCGLTSLVMALNVLEIDPGRIWKGPWRWYHEEMLDCCTPLPVAREKGINMEQFVCLARCNNLSAISKPAFEIASLDELREEIKRATSKEDEVFVASYSRRVLGQTGDGHFSPVAGYHEGRDLVLILDTARFKYPPHWIPLQVLLDAMRTTDSETGQPRGYVVLTSAKNQPGLLLFRPSCAFTVDTTRGSLCSQLLDFAREWEQLQGSMIKVPSEQKAVIHQALEHMLKMKSQSTQFISMFCTVLPCVNKEEQGTGYVLECQQPCAGLKEVSCAIKGLITELEALETFKVVKDYLTSKMGDEREKFMRLIQESHDCIETQHHLKTQHHIDGDMSECCKISRGLTKYESIPEPKIPKLSETSTGCSPCEGTLKIGPEHAVTLFLQVWPHGSSFFRKSSPSSVDLNTNKSVSEVAPQKDSNQDGLTDSEGTRSFGSLLMEFIASDLSRSGQYVRDEIITIKFKVREVLRYHGQGITTYCCKVATSS